MKKSVLILGLFVFSILMINFVVAQALPAPPVTLNQIGKFFDDLLKGTSGGESLARLLLAMLITAVLYQPALKITNEKPGVAFIVAFIVSVLGVRFLSSSEMIQGILLPYGALAIVISSVLPFLLAWLL